MNSELRVAIGIVTAILMIAAAPSAGQTTSQPTSQPAKPVPVARYMQAARQIRESAEAGHDGYRKLEELCDDIGHRLSGSPQLDQAIAWAIERLKRDGHENVRGEKVLVPKWVRGEESLELVEPRRKRLAMLGLGGSVGTPPEGITAEVISVFDEEELRKLGDAAKGKIVLFDQPMSRENEESGAGYGSAVRFRGSGAIWAGAQGAAACLVRSVTTRSLHSPHTGGMGYFDAPVRIPAAAIATEDAEAITRWCKRGVKVVVTLKMSARDEGRVESANVVAEVRGRENPEEVVVIGGHLDSWDVGSGAQDDGGGCVTAMEALNVLRKLNLIPRRTIRVVLFTNEENGLAGGTTYARDHADELPRHVAAIESDSGIAALRAFGIDMEEEGRAARAVEQLDQILGLLRPSLEIPARKGWGGADIRPMRSAGVALIGVGSDMTHYFDVHHTHADTLDKIDPAHLTQHVIAMATVAYVVADMPLRLGDTAD